MARTKYIRFPFGKIGWLSLAKIGVALKIGMTFTGSFLLSKWKYCKKSWFSRALIFTGFIIRFGSLTVLYNYFLLLGNDVNGLSIKPHVILLGLSLTSLYFNLNFDISNIIFMKDVFLFLQVDAGYEARKKQEYEEKTKRLARRKQNRLD